MSTNSNPKIDHPYDGGPAFPRPTSSDETINPANIDYGAPGMSLRDYFAGQALVGLAGAVTADDMEALTNGVIGGRFVAGAAYALADAMLKARDQ